MSISVLMRNSLVIAALLAVSCGGGGNPASKPNINPPTTRPSDPNVINGIPVPPDPGAAGEATVAGIDTDNNGIRDDIDRFIAAKYGTNSRAVKAARQSAAARQQVITADATNRTAARIALQDSGDAGVCAGKAFREAGLDPGSELEEIFLRTYNTPERLEQYKSVTGAAGQFTRSVTSVECPE